MSRQRDQLTRAKGELEALLPRLRRLRLIFLVALELLLLSAAGLIFILLLARALR